MSGTTGKLPLHYASKIDNIMYLLIEYPPSIKVKDNDGHLPLHCACCSHTTTLEGIQLLVHTHPYAMFERNRKGFLLLQILKEFSHAAPAILGWLEASIANRWICVRYHILRRARVEGGSASLLDTSESSV